MNEHESKAFDIKNEPSSSTQEVLKNPEQHETQETRQKELEHSAKHAEEARASIDTIETDVIENNVAEDLDQETASKDIMWTSRELLGQTYGRTLSYVRNRLGGSDKTFSKVIHQPFVEKTSDVLEKTIARPSGILFGGVFSFVGSLAAYLLAKRLGGELPNSVFAIFFVGGFFAGLLIELVWRLVKMKKLK